MIERAFPDFESSCARCGAQVAKSIQMAMGLHADDVAFFLAADEPATYLQVLRSPSAPSKVMCSVIAVLCCMLASGTNLQLEKAATGLASHLDMLYHMQQCMAWSERKGMSQVSVRARLQYRSCTGGPDTRGAARDLDRERHRAHRPALCKGR